MSLIFVRSMVCFCNFFRIEKPRLKPTAIFSFQNGESDKNNMSETIVK